MEERQDSYVRVTLNQHYRTVKVKRTSTVKGTDSPNFSECFNFRVPSAQIDVTSVGLQVHQTVSGYGRDKLIGKFVLGSYMFARGKALSHWNAAFSNPMEQVQHWHTLCE
ncbi:Synaptotagmin-15 [Blattella germanica]|nr:Synaptotagmin-15 [Blattella germanica]